MFLQEKQISISKVFDILKNYVDLSTSQTIKAQKTFDGEQKFLNTQYCPTITDTANGVGCAFKASRGLFNEALMDKIVMTGTTKKIPFMSYTGTSAGSMTGMIEVASLDNTGALTTSGSILINNKDGLYTQRVLEGNTFKDQFYNMAANGNSVTTLNRWKNEVYQGALQIGNNSSGQFIQLMDTDMSTKYQLYGEHNTNLLKAVIQEMIESGEIEVGSSSSGIQVFESNGTFTVPKGVSAIYITACAGGGGGGGGGYTSSSGSNGRYRYTGGGGGGGGVIVKKFYSVTPESSISITVGTGGAGGNGCGATGSAGGNTIIGSLITLNGGTGGTSASSSAGEGGTGGQGAGGGGGYGTGAAGNSAFSSFLIPFYSTSTTSAAGISGIYKGGKGGNSNEGFGGGGSLGAGGDGGVNKANGNPGEYGGGGGGAGGNSLVSGTTSSYRGGQGGNGIVIIEW